MPHLVNYYCINSDEMDEIITDSAEIKLKWHQINMAVSSLNVAHYAEIKPNNWMISVGREPGRPHVKIASPSEREAKLPLESSGIILVEGEYREWEYFKKLYFELVQSKTIDEERIEDYIFFASQVICTLLKRCYGRWFAPDAGLRDIPRFYPELEELYTPFIDDFPRIKKRIPINIDKDFMFSFDPDCSLTIIPKNNVRPLRKELEKRKFALVEAFLTTGWKEESIKEALVPMLFDMLDWAHENQRSVLIRY